MAGIGNNGDTNEVVKLLREAIYKQRKAADILVKQGKTRAAQSLLSQVTRLETLVNVDLADLAGISLGTTTQTHPLVPAFFHLWRKKYPKYGEPSKDERAKITELFRLVISEAYPEATELLIERVIDNFDQSTGWVRENREMWVFARHFRKFVNGPFHPGSERFDDDVVMRSDGRVSIGR